LVFLFFSPQNYVGFGKILKKYDKAAGEKVRKSFMERLDQEEFFKSGELGTLIQHTETVFFVISDGKQLTEVALAMAAPEKAAKLEWIMKPNILLLALVVFFILFFCPILDARYFTRPTLC
jgi:SPX domain protein involved in polyphosphate accumulation